MKNTKVTNNSFQHLNILIVGDAMLDRYLIGEVKRISPEAPVPVVEYKKSFFRPGGAANVALNVSSLGANVFICSVIGNDQNGEDLKSRLIGMGIDCGGLLLDNLRPTSVKTRIMVANQQLLRVDKESVQPISGELEKRIFIEFSDRLINQEIHGIILQDYNKGVLTEPLIKKMILKAREYDIPCFVDPKQLNFMAYQKVHLFKPNLREIRDQIPFDFSTKKESLDKAADFLIRKLGCEKLIITLSEKGIYWNDGKRSAISPVLNSNKVVDVSGAGDTVISVLTLFLLIRSPIEEVVKIANIAAGIVCEKPGVVNLEMEDLKRRIQQAE